MNSRRADAGQARLRRGDATLGARALLRWREGPPTPGGLPPNPQPSLHIRGRGGGPRLRESPQSTRRALATAKAKEPGYSPGPSALSPQSSCSRGSENRGRSHLTAHKRPISSQTVCSH